MTLSQKEKVFLISTGIWLIPIALSYWFIPDMSLQYLYDITINNINWRHIFRAINSLYFAMIGLWFLGAFQEKYRLIALYTMAIFMFGLVSGRIVSFIVDGIPHWLLVFYAVAEIFSGFIALSFINKRNKIS